MRETTREEGFYRRGEKAREEEEGGHGSRKFTGGPHVPLLSLAGSHRPPVHFGQWALCVPKSPRVNDMALGHATLSLSLSVSIMASNSLLLLSLITKPCDACDAVPLSEIEELRHTILCLPSNITCI